MNRSLRVLFNFKNELKWEQLQRKVVRHLFRSFFSLFCSFLFSEVFLSKCSALRLTFWTFNLFARYKQTGNGFNSVCNLTFSLTPMKKQDCLPNPLWSSLLECVTFENKKRKCQIKSNDIKCICWLPVTFLCMCLVSPGFGE